MLHPEPIRVSVPLMTDLTAHVNRGASSVQEQSARRRPTAERPKYLIESVISAADLLRAFQSPAELLRLRDVAARTALQKSLCFRLLHTLRHCGFIDKVDGNRYRLTIEIQQRKRWRIGYTALGHDTSFQAAVQESLILAARAEEIELIVLDNRRDPRMALRNAEHLVREKVDFVIEFQIDEAIAAAISARYMDAGIPFIAVHVPHPGGTYYGANNYQAGLLAGHYLGRWAKSRWSGKVDEFLLIDATRAGSLIHGRIAGVRAGLKEVLRDTMDPSRVVIVDGEGRFKLSLERVRRHLRRLD